MTDVAQPRHVTAGRPLPPRKAPPLEPAANDLPFQQVVSTAPVTAATVAPPAAVGPAQPPGFGRPDPRPMRLAFGATAVAAVSFMAGSFVQPGFSSTANAQAAAADVLPGSTRGAAQGSQPAVQRITRYIFLAPGEKAPPGATVISAGDSQPGSGAAVPTTSQTTSRAPVAQPDPAGPERVTTRQSGS